MNVDMPAAPVRATDRYAVIGRPIAQSRSPDIHRAFAEASGGTIDYVRIEGTEGGFAADVDAFRARGGRGLNITAPFKLDAFRYASVLQGDARLAGAVNCLSFDPETGAALGCNFDGVGLLRDIVDNLHAVLAGRRVLLMGAGGAARGALRPLLAAGPSLLVVANRDVGRAEALAHGFPPCRASAYDALPGQFDVVVNATSASLSNELPPVPPGAFAPGCLAYDMTYGKGLTPFLQMAQAAGAGHLADGVGMLVEQAAEAFALWRGVRPATAPVIAALTVPLVRPGR